MRQASNVIEAVFRAGALQLGASRLKRGRKDSAYKAEKNKACCRHSDFVPLNELNCAIIDCILSCRDRTTFKVAANVIGKLGDGAITSAGLLPQRLQDDVVEISTKEFRIADFGLGIPGRR